jgi:hypothetical protein
MLPKLGNGNTIIFGCIVGSHAYGTAVPGSDIDRKWVYIQHPTDLFINGYRPQIELNKDEVAFELSRFIELALKANPTILELLYSPEDCVLYRDPVFASLEVFKKEFLTKQCRYSFGGYAISQIEKARGLEKKMNWEKEKTVRKTVLDFCYWIDQAIDPRINEHFQTAPMKTVFSALQLKRLGLSKLPNTRDLYSVFADTRYPFKGIVSDEEESNDINLSNIPKDAQVAGLMFFNKDAYSLHCKEYKEYVDWLEKRNKQRYVDIEGHGQQIDGKNLLHCVRLIETAIDIATKGELIVRRKNADFLKDIRLGKVNLEDILSIATSSIEAMDKLFKESGLPEKFDVPDTLKHVNYRMRLIVNERNKDNVEVVF